LVGVLCFTFLFFIIRFYSGIIFSLASASFALRAAIRRNLMWRLWSKGDHSVKFSFSSTGHEIVAWLLLHHLYVNYSKPGVIARYKNLAPFYRGNKNSHAISLKGMPSLFRPIWSSGHVNQAFLQQRRPGPERTVGLSSSDYTSVNRMYVLGMDLVLSAYLYPLSWSEPQ
jgi:hypothetical protein